MSEEQELFTSSSEQTPLVSAGRDMRKLKKNGVATAGAGVLLVVFTVVPFAWGKVSGGGSGGDGQGAKEEVVAKGPGGEKAERVETPEEAKEPEGAGEMPEVNLSNGEDTVDKLGIGETIEAPTNVNPLEGASDDLLKDLD
jgi:hypothetical protein